jgi:hypothetical protein
MEYLDFIPQEKGRYSTDKSPLDRLISENSLMQILTEKGYATKRIGSWYSLTNYSESNKDILSRFFFTEFTITLVNTTILHPFSEQMLSPMLREGVLNSFDEIKAHANTLNPTFVFAHIICPHPPFIFDENGNSLGVTESISQKINPKIFYINQLKFINKKVQETVDSLLINSKIDPVIIIQGDHGAAYISETYMYSKGESPDWFIQSQMGILNSYYVPEELKKKLYPEITPVNSFRVILNGLLNTNYPILSDSSFFSTHVYPYDFKNVTKKIK